MHPAFCRDFDEEHAAARAHEERAARARYTEEDLAAAIEAARAEGQEAGRAEGHAAGAAEMRDTLLARHAEALETLVPQLETLLRDAAAHRAALEAQVVDFVLSVCEQVFPEFLRTRARDRAREQVEDTLRLALGSATVRIRLAPDTLAALRPRIEAAWHERGARGPLEIIGDEGLGEGDARMEWDNGFMDYSFAEVCNRILGALRARGAGAAAEQTNTTGSMTRG